MTHAYARAHAAPAKRGNTPITVHAPDTYATPETLARYVAAMTLRAEMGAKSGRPAVIYLAGLDRGRSPAAAIRHRAEVERVLSPARTVYYRAVWPMVARPGSLGELPAYPAGIEVMAARIDGVVVMLSPTGLLPSDVLAEIRAVRERTVPIVVRAPGGALVPLVDCRMRPGAGGLVRVELPAARHGGRRETLTVALAAMGADAVRVGA